MTFSTKVMRQPTLQAMTPTQNQFVEDLLVVASGSADLDSMRLPLHTPQLLFYSLCSGVCLLEDLEEPLGAGTCICVLKKHRRAKSRVHRVHVRPIVLDTLFILSK